MTDLENIVFYCSAYIATGLVLSIVPTIYAHYKLRSALLKMGEKDEGIVTWLASISMSDLCRTKYIFAWPVALYQNIENFISGKLISRRRKIDGIFVDARVKQLKSLAKNETELTDLLLADKDERIRSYAAHDLAKSISPEQIERGLTDGSSAVRMAFIGNHSLKLTPEQIERALTDKDQLVRREMAFRRDYIATPMQIERGISDENDHVRFWFFERYSGSALSKEQIERGLNDRNPEIREWTARRG